jgi:hypothetical protein
MTSGRKWVESQDPGQSLHLAIPELVQVAQACPESVAVLGLVHTDLALGLAHMADTAHDPVLAPTTVAREPGHVPDLMIGPDLVHTTAARGLVQGKAVAGGPPTTIREAPAHQTGIAAMTIREI